MNLDFPQLNKIQNNIKTKKKYWDGLPHPYIFKICNLLSCEAKDYYYNCKFNYMYGTVVVWGWNISGQCDVPDLRPVKAIACGGFHSMALQRGC